MKLVTGVLAAVIVFASINSQAKETKKERSPNQVSTNLGKKLSIKVKAANLKSALEQIAKNSKVKAVFKSVNEQLKNNYPAQLEPNFDAEKAMVVLSGKSGSDFYIKHIVPVYGLVEGSGNMSVAFLLAQIDENASMLNMEDENSLKSYAFTGFIKVKTIDISDKDQLSGLDVD